MGASPSEIAAAIEPGSTEYGNRQELEAGLATLPSGEAGEAPAPNPAAGVAAPPVDMGSDPLSALLSGAVDPGNAGPVTQGMSVGPGAGPPGAQEDPTVVKLRKLAMQSSSPVLRALARRELLRITRTNKL